MAQMKLVYTTSIRLSELPIENGQIIYAPDDNLICLDMRDRRFTYHTLRSFKTDAERLRFIGVNKCFYFVEETSVLWHFDKTKGWEQMTSAPDERLVFDNYDNFPVKGKTGVLYCAPEAIYQWNTSLSSYIKMGEQVWENI